MKKKTKVIAILLALVIVIPTAFLLSGYRFSKKADLLTEGTADAIKVYTSEQCGCCSVYASELRRQGFNAEVVNVDVNDLTSIKDKYSIPQDMRSCHTVVIGNYFVEGHMPFEAIVKMMNEKPDIKGIALPGMPSGAPGMAGGKTETFVIYAINKDGSTSEFMRI